MKKSALLAACLGLALCLVWPAMAFQVKVGARVDTDIGYVWQSGNSYWSRGRNNSRMPDLTTFYVAMPGTNYVRFDFMSNDKSTGARIEIGIQAGGPADGHGASAIALRHMYGWYKFGRCKLVIGHTDNLFASLAYAPYQWFGRGIQIGTTTIMAPWDFGWGTNAPTYMFIGQGKQYSGRFVQIALYYDVGPWTFMAALGQASTLNYFSGPHAMVQNVPNTMYPRLDVVVRYQDKYISLAPGFSIFQSELEPIVGGHIENDRVLSYCLVLPFKVSFGAFRIKGELSHGMNWITTDYPEASYLLNVAVYWGGLNDGLVRTKTEDTYFLAACLGLEYHIGRVSLHLGGGWQKVTNASNDQNGTWRHGQNVRWAANFAVRYRVNRHFVIAPEISYWVYGWDPVRDVAGAGAMIADYGSIWLAGISFQFRF